MNNNNDNNNNNNPYTDIASSSKHVEHVEVSVASSSKNVEVATDLSNINDQDYNSDSIKEESSLKYDYDLSDNLEHIDGTVHLIQSMASDGLSEPHKQKVDNIRLESKEAFDELKDFSQAIRLSNETSDPRIEKLAVEKSNEACDILYESVSKTDKIFKENHSSNDYPVDLDHYEDNLTDLDILKVTRDEYSSKYVEYLDQQIEQLDQGLESLDHNEEEISSTDKGKARARSWELEDSEVSDNKKQKMGKDLVQEYADVSTEPADWTAGDD